jgi:4-amino-4-deoxy-L-arabinose transferase-like glycosyltransferase
VSEQDSQAGTLPASVLTVGVLAAAIAILWAAIRLPVAVLSAAKTAVTEGGLVALIVIAAGGWGYPIVRRFCKADVSTGLRVATAALGGLWLLSTAVLAAGSLTHGLLKVWIWWPVVGVGVVLAAWQGRARLEAWRWPAHLDGRSLVWVLIALVVGLWLAGAMLPPGFMATFGDDYDVLEYHLQLPRQYYLDQHVTTLPNNVYSHYPLGVEMLFLLCMTLRGGAYEGMYAAKLMHGAFGVLAVAAMFWGLRREEDSRARFSVALLATMPLAIYLSWLAMVELAEVAYLVVALLWLRQWMRSPSAGAALAIGAMLGGACAVKYLSVGFVLGPIVVVMLAWPLITRRLAPLGHVVAAVAVAAVLLAPCLVRNTITAGNPVFPLASEFFGRPNFWPAECQQRWLNGHGPQLKPPVPQPADYEAPVTPAPLELFYHNFVLSQWFGGLPSRLLIAIAVCALIATTQRADPWDWALVAVFVMQLAVWAAATRGMPPRFATVVIVPMALLSGGMLARLGRVQTNPFRKDAARPSYGPWGMMPAVAAVVTAAAVNLLVGYNIYAYSQAGLRDTPFHGILGSDIAALAPPYQQAHQLPAGSRILLVGDAKGFYFPSHIAYATAFNAQPLDEMIRQGLSPAAILAQLHRDGITHLWFDWFEIRRLATTYGFPASLSAELPQRWRDDRPPSLPILRELQALGMTVAGQIELPSAATAPASAPASEPATKPAHAVKPAPPAKSAHTTKPAPATASAPTSRPAWPVVTIYALPKPPPVVSPVEPP